MKKIYFLALSFIVGAGAIAQTTITNHFEDAVSDANPANWAVGYYNWGPGNGYVSGTNTFDDKAILQKFDASYGITGAGTIDALNIYIIQKNDSGNGTTVSLAIWEDNAGVPGAILGSVDVTIADIDTALAATQVILDGAVVKGLYNTSVTFTTPIAIPANMSFFAGITVPATAQAAQGDTVVVLTTTMPNYVFADASTHAGALNENDGFDSYGSSSVNIANAIFPTVTIASSASINENNLSINAYPNPATSELNITMSANATSVAVISMDGKVVASQEVNGTSTTINVANLNSGVYFYEVTTENGLVVRNTFVKN